MGFGNGYSVKHDRGGKRYDNTMVAHVWNSANEDSGQSHNGNLYFRGAAIYSYGSHFVLAYRMPDGVIFVNNDRNSVTTSGHQSDVRRAISNRKIFVVDDLTEFASEWKLLPRLASFLSDDGTRNDRTARDAMRVSVKAALRSHWKALTATMRDGAASWKDVEGATEAGAYLAGLVGIPAASWSKIKRECAKAEADAKAAKARSDRAASEARAIRLADMSAKSFRETLNRESDMWTPDNLKSTGKELRNARKMMMAAKRGPLAAASRLATVRERIKMVSHYIATHAQRKAIRSASERERRMLGVVRAWRDASDAMLYVNSRSMRELSSAGEWLAQHGRTSKLKASGQVLCDQAHLGRLACEAEESRLAMIRDAERETQRLADIAEAKERKAAWLRGEPVRAGYFDSDHGGAALRVVADQLETSHGASVPLAHAVKVFRFVKLCRDRAEAWHRNGKTIRVGHFQVDAIDAQGNFRAGCHDIRWAEVERVAIAAGVFDCAPSADALEPSHA